MRDLPLLWKLLVPAVLLALLTGVAGTFLVVRDLSSRAQADLDRALFGRSVAAKAYLLDQEFYLLEAVRFAVNLQGLQEAVATGDRARASELLASVAALKDRLNLLVATDAGGAGLVEISRAGGKLSVTQGGSWAGRAFVAEVLQGLVDATGDKRAGVLPSQSTTSVAVAGPIGLDPRVGAVIAGMDLSELAPELARRIGASAAFFDLDGRLLASSESFAAGAGPPPLAQGGPVRRTSTAGGEEVDTLYSPLEVRGKPIGTLAVGLPTAPALASARGAGFRLALIVVFAVAGAMVLFALVARLVLAQVKPLVETNRALGRGELSVRAPVLGEDELGELAKGFNLMAEQLQASYEELEMRVAQRTEEVRRLYDDLKRASETRSEMFAGVSHEFRTPLFTILGHAEMMLDPKFRPDGSRWRMEFGNAIRHAGENLLTLVNDILDLVKVESGKMKVSLKDVRLQELMEELKKTVVPLARASELSVEFDWPADLPPVHADSARLRQVILNLASNAVKYTPPGGEVRVAAVVRNGRVEVSVADTGIGIPEDVGDRVFEPFYQVAGAEPQKGQPSSGLGLALVRRLVEAHGGDLWYESKPGAGATFFFTLSAAAKRRRPVRAGRGAPLE